MTSCPSCNVKSDHGYPHNAWLNPYDGKNLLSLVRSGKNPFADHGLDMDLVISEIEEGLRANVVDIPLVTEGAHNLVSLP